MLSQVAEIYNFSQDDLMTEDMFILDCHSDIFVWVGLKVESKTKMQALTIGEVRNFWHRLSSKFAMFFLINFLRQTFFTGTTQREVCKINIRKNYHIFGPKWSGQVWLSIRMLEVKWRGKVGSTCLIWQSLCKDFNTLYDHIVVYISFEMLPFR